METLDIEQFSPRKAELQQMAQDYSALVIQGTSDIAGYQAVDVARKELKRARVEISKTGKSLREEAVAFQKAVIGKEKELIALIEPVEIKLAAQQAQIDELKLAEKRRADLPVRLQALQEVGEVMAEDFILLMDDPKFNTFIVEARQKRLAEKEAELKAKEEANEKERLRLEEIARTEKARQEAREEAARQAEAAIKQAALKAEQDKQAAVEAERLRSEKEKQAILDEQKRKEDEAKAAVEAEKVAKELAEKQAAEAEEKQKKQKKYQKFLADNGWTEENQADFKLVRGENEVELYKLVAKFII